MTTRREILKTALAAPLALKAAPRGKADACIFLWLGGGAAQIDTFDPKARGDGKLKPGSYYNSIDTAINGAKVCEHLRLTAPLLDRCALVRTISHDIVGEHAAAANLMHTGRKPSGTILWRRATRGL